MNKTTAGVIVAVIAIIGVGGAVLIANRNDGDPSTADHASMGHSSQQQSATSSTDTDQAEAKQTSSVEIKDYAYAPPKIQIKKGTRVTWTNQDEVRHDVAPDQDSDDFKKSELLGKGESYSFTFNTTGTYTYHCSPHPYMKGTVEVTE